MTYPPLPMTRRDALERVGRVVADVAAGRLQSYWAAGKGGRDPRAPLPFTGSNQADCSGFVAWACGYDRIQDRSVSTGVIEADAMLPGGMFELVQPGERVQAGDVLVYGPYSGDDGEARMGHTGIITRVLPGFERRGPSWWTKLEVAHSSPSNSQRFGSGHALAVTDATIWRRRGYIVRYLGWRPDPEATLPGDVGDLVASAVVLLVLALGGA